ncbi:MAG: hypothetical protein IKE41_02575, partial [Clostridia bacterium]|nr:hypothetical protein [Clostridia bacterium]MBR2734851.1 hypothetical protein [Clostridia bacterium]
MHKNFKRSFCSAMAFLMFCQFGGYSDAAVTKDAKKGSELTVGQKIKAFFDTTIPNHPGETAAVGGSALTLAAILAALGITKPWKHEQDVEMEEMSPPPIPKSPPIEEKTDNNGCTPSVFGNDSGNGQTDDSVAGSQLKPEDKDKNVDDDDNLNDE